VPHPHRVLQQCRAGALHSDRGGPTNRFMIGVAIAGPRYRAPRSRAPADENVGQQVGQSVLVVGDLPVGQAQRYRFAEAQGAGGAVKFHPAEVFEAVALQRR
jgi:hypothetical protein